MILTRDDTERVLTALERLPPDLRDRNTGVRRLRDAASWLLRKRGIPSVSLATRRDAIAVVAGLDQVDPALADLAQRAQDHLSGRDCTHPTTRNLYDQRPPSEGRRLTARARVCENCGALLQLDPGGA